MIMTPEEIRIGNIWSGYYSEQLNETKPKEQLQNVNETAGEARPISVEENEQSAE